MLKITVVCGVLLAAYALVAWNDERVALLEREEAATRLCFPVFDDETATLASVNGRFECAIKRGHTVVARFEL